MESLNTVRDKLSGFYQKHPVISNALLIGSSLYALNKVYKKWQYSQKIFPSESETNNKVILITGCGHGFGNTLALKLSIKCGYRVIATCRTQKSVDKFLSNSKYTANKSTAVIMDITNDENIENAKNFTIKYLDETNSILWGIVNNAGLFFAGEFELVQPKLDKLERDVLLDGPLNVIRIFLPLLPGRKNYKINDENFKLEYKTDGGRIVNVSSMAARICMHDTRYGVSKVAISYFTHSLRRELSPRFGIWCSVVEPGGYKTNIINAGMKWSKKINEELKENDKEELMDIYQFDLDFYAKRASEDEKKYFNPNYDEVIDNIIHGLTAYYPQREYVPGSNFIIKIMEILPISVWDKLSVYTQNQMIPKKDSQ